MCFAVCRSHDSQAVLSASSLLPTSLQELHSSYKIVEGDSPNLQVSFRDKISVGWRVSNVFVTTAGNGLHFHQQSHPDEAHFGT